MKKTLLALAVLAAAGSAQAGIEIYNNEGVTVNLKGDIEVTYQNSKKSSSMTQQIEDADFGFDVRYAINDQVAFGGYWEFDGSPDNNSSDANSGDAYVALYTADYGSIKVGRLCTAIDDIGIGNDYQFGVASFFDKDTFECEDEALRYDYDNGMFYATLGYVQNKLDGADDNGYSGEKNAYIDGYVGARFAGFDAKVIASNYDNDDTKVKSSLVGAEVAYGGIDNLNLSVGYYSVSAENTYADETDDNVDNVVTNYRNRDNDTWAIAADYTIEKWTFGTGFSSTDSKVALKDEDRWFVNAGYAVAPATTAYVEVAGVDAEGTVNNENLLALGVKAAF